MLKFACRITGDDYLMVSSDTPSSRKKVLTLAISVLVPTIMWFINGLLITSIVMEKSWSSGILVAVIMSCIIFIIEKLVVMSNGGLFLAAFRGFLAFIVAILGSIFMDEVIFTKDIDQQIAISKENAAQKASEQIKQQNEKEIADKSYEVNTKYVAWQEKLQASNDEADGTKGSGRKGVSDITRLKSYNALLLQQDYENANNELAIIQEGLNQKITVAENRVKKSFQERGLLVRIKAMFDMILADNAMLILYIVVTLFLFCLEFIVIIVKLSLQKTNYEYRLELIEEIGRKRMEKIRQNDTLHFEPYKLTNAYKSAREQMKKSTTSLYN